MHSLRSISKTSSTASYTSLLPRTIRPAALSSSLHRTPTSPPASITSYSTWKGRDPDDHLLNDKDSHHPQHVNSKAARQEREHVESLGQGQAQEGKVQTSSVSGQKQKQGKSTTEGDGDAQPSSQAITQRDRLKGKEKAKEEFPEAPVTIGMEDERGGVSLALFPFCSF